MEFNSWKLATSILLPSNQHGRCDVIWKSFCRCLISPRETTVTVRMRREHYWTMRWIITSVAAMKSHESNRFERRKNPTIKFHFPLQASTWRIRIQIWFWESSHARSFFVKRHEIVEKWLEQRSVIILVILLCQGPQMKNRTKKRTALERNLRTSQSRNTRVSYYTYFRNLSWEWISLRYFTVVIGRTRISEKLEVSSVKWGERNSNLVLRVVSVRLWVRGLTEAIAKI